MIGTKSDKGESNLAIISSVVHLGSNPPFLGFILRPMEDVRRHTYENILENGFFTINHIHKNFVEKAHFTSAKFEKEVSEFSACGLTEEYLFDFSAPFVKESQLKIGLRLAEKILVKSSNTILVVGEIEHLIIPDRVIDERGYLDLGSIDNIGISGLNSYYEIRKINEFPYARVDELPDFSK